MHLDETLHFVATLHPDLIETKSKNYDGSLFTRQEKEKQILDFYRNKKAIPLCIDHCGADHCHFIVPEKERIGYVDDLFIGKKGDLMVKLSLDMNHPYFPRISQGLRKEPWGVSVWIEHNKYYNTKELTHVALTTDPYFGPQGTYLHKFDIGERGVYRAIAKDYYQEGCGECFATKELKKKLNGMEEN